MADVPKIAKEDRDLARYVHTTFEVLAETFTRAQRATDRAGSTLLDAFAGSRDKVQEAAAMAFAIARAQNWLPVFCEQCYRDGVVERAFLGAAVTQTRDSGLVELHGLIDVGSAMTDSYLKGQLLVQTSEHICRIEIDGSHSGTGFLIKPKIVLTAGHVIRPLLLDDNEAPPLDARDRVTIWFGDYFMLVEGRRQRQPFKIELAQDWLVARKAPCASAPGIATLDATLDYALLRLERQVWSDKSLSGLAAARISPLAKDPIIVMQHPRGVPLKDLAGEVHDVRANINRFTHTVGTLQGSSGGPCLDANFNVIGIHQGEIKGPPKLNVGLLLAAALADAKDALDRPGAQDYLMWYEDEKKTPRPVLGRRETQDWLALSVLEGQSRILAIPQPQEDSPAGPVPLLGVGMSFTLEILRAALPPERHRIVSLSADIFQADSAETFVRKRLFPGAGANGADLPLAPGDTTDVAWLRYELVPFVTAALDAARGEQMLWIALDDLRVPLADRTGLREFLDLLYERVVDLPWLRFVLLGYGATPPLAVRPFFAWMDLPKVDVADAESYFSTWLKSRLPNHKAEALHQNFTSLVKSVGLIPARQRLAFLSEVLSSMLSVADL